MDCAAEKVRLDELVDRLSLDLNKRAAALSTELENEVEKITDDAPEPDGGLDNAIGVEIEFEWVTETFKLHLPEVEMKRQTWIFDLPSVTMREKRMVFHTPGVCMKRKKIGQYPEIHGFTVKWKNIYTDVPEPCMKKQEIVMGVPEFRMEEQKVVVDIPEVAMRLQEIKIDLPRIKVINLEVAARETSDRVEAAEEEFRTELEEAKADVFGSGASEVSNSVNTLFSCYRTSIQNSKDAALASFGPALEQVRKTIQKLKSAGATDDVPRLEQELEKLIREKKSSELRFDEALANLFDQEKETLRAILGDFAP